MSASSQRLTARDGSLWIATSKGKFEVIELLVKRGADVNVRDGIWYQTPLSMSAPVKKIEAAQLLIKAGAKDVDGALSLAVAAGNLKMVEMILKEAKVSQDALDAALYSATGFKNAKVQEALKKAGAKPLPDASEHDRQAWKKLAGTYESEGGGPLVISLKPVGLVSSGRFAFSKNSFCSFKLSSSFLTARMEFTMASIHPFISNSPRSRVAAAPSPE